MTTNEYLKQILSSQNLAEGSDELKALQEHRADVEKLLRDNFAACSPTIRYGGSKAKGTMNRESYDLDLICYFPNDDTAAGETLENIYNNVGDALKKKYVVERKTSVLRIKNADPANYGVDFHIDVVPGRYTDDAKSDAFLYQSGAEKKRLKTNLDTHIKHIRDSGVTDAIRLVKLWKVRNGIVLKNFVLELAVIELLKDKKRSDLAAQLEHVWTEFRDNIDDLSVKDPANPEGNDLSAAFSDSVKANLGAVARRTLDLIKTSGWEAVFGPVEHKSEAEKAAALRRIAAAVAVPTKPWCHDA
jgi:hypothetical protein